MKKNTVRYNLAVKIAIVSLVLALIAVGIYFFTTMNQDAEAENGTNEVANSNEPATSKEEIDGKTIQVSQLGHVNTERQRLKVTFGPAYYIPTGLYVTKDQKITVTLNEHDQILNPRLIISPPVLASHEDAEDDGNTIKPGTREITARDEGILYIVNNNYETDTPPEMTIEGASTLPTFELGQTTLDEWDEILEENIEAPAFELVSDKAVITAGMSHVKLVSNPEELLIKHDQAIDIEAEASGLYEDDPDPLHQPTKYRYHFRHGEGDFWMYAFFNHTGYHTDAIRDLLNVETFTKNGWGPWHELGHVHQQPATTPGMFGEVTNNVFSMTVQREFGQTSRLENENRYDTAFNYLEDATGDFHDLGDFEALVPLWQLDLAYGQDLYPQIYRMVRESEDNELPTEDEAKIQNFVLLTSQSAEQNLVPFFERWGLEMDEEVKAEIAALDYPEVSAPIWWNRDSNNTIKTSDVTIDSLAETLNAYEEDLPEEAYTEINEHVTAAQDKNLSTHMEELTDLLTEQKETEEITEKMYEILQSQIDLMEI